MPRRKDLPIEKRNELERSAIDLGKVAGFDRRGSMLIGFVEGYMTAALTPPLQRKRKAKSKFDQMDLTRPIAGPAVHVSAPTLETRKEKANA